jgi:hypothetical protein
VLALIIESQPAPGKRSRESVDFFALAAFLAAGEKSL